MYYNPKPLSKPGILYLPFPNLWDLFFKDLCVGPALIVRHLPSKPGDQLMLGLKTCRENTEPLPLRRSPIFVLAMG